MYICRGGAPNTYPDPVCRSDYHLHSYDPPLLYDLNSDPSEVYNLDVNEYSEVIAQIDKVSSYISLYLQHYSCFYISSRVGTREYLFKLVLVVMVTFKECI